MATQLKAADDETIVDPEGVNDAAGVDDGPRNYEAEALELGWRPPDEFKGDPARCVDAKTFVERADTVMPLLKKKLSHLERENRDIKKQARRITEHFNQAEERIRAELMEKMEKAVVTGDVAGFKALQKENEKLTSSAAKPEHTAADAREAFDSFRDTNPWYDRANLGGATELEVNARLYADRMTEKHLEKTNDMAPAEFFGFIEGLVKEKYPTIGVKAARQKPASDVAGTTPNRGAGQRGKTFADLPPAAQAAADKWIKQGLIKDRAAYVASYDWS